MYDYTRFKEDAETRNFELMNNGYLRVTKFIAEIVGEENILSFYSKNIYNSNPTVLYFFLENGILSVTKTEENDFVYEHIYNKVIKKKLLTSKYYQLNHELRITLDNEKEIIFE